MSVRLIGAHNLMGPVAVNTSATIVRNSLVRVASGLVTTVTTATTVGLAVALDKYPDTDFGGTKTQVQLARLGEDQEVEVAFSGAAVAAATFGGGPYRVLDGGTVDLGSTTGGVFTPLRLGRNTAIGATTGFLVGVFSDAASW